MRDEELNLLRLTLTGFGSAFDGIALVVFIAFAVIYVIAPPLGYESDRRGGLALALYLLVGFAAVTLVQMLLQWSQMMGMVEPGVFGRGPAPLDGAGQLSLSYYFAFSVMKMVLFVASLASFVVGIRRLRMRPPPLPEPHAAHTITTQDAE